MLRPLCVLAGKLAQHLEEEEYLLLILAKVDFSVFFVTKKKNRVKTDRLRKCAYCGGG